VCIADMDLEALSYTHGRLLRAFGLMMIAGGATPTLRAAWAGVTSAKAKPSRHMLKTILLRYVFMTPQIHEKPPHMSTPMHIFHNFF